MFIPFQDHNRKNAAKVAIASTLFHIVIIGIVAFIFWVKPEPERKEIHIFEVIQMPAPPKAAPKRPKRSRPKPPPPKVKEEPRPVKEKKPEPKKEKPKKEEKKPEKQVKKETPPDTLPPEMDLPDAPAPAMDLPEFAEVGALQTHDASYMHDPLLQEYLARVEAKLMAAFHPPTELDIPKGTVTKVTFTIQRSGKITGLKLKTSSGNKTYDRLSIRAVKVNNPLPPLPPFFRAPALGLNFGFRNN